MGYIRHPSHSYQPHDCLIQNNIGLRVLMLACQHEVVGNFAILERFERFWLDLEQKVLFGTGLCEVEPKAVASLQRDFEQTFNLYSLEARVGQR